MLPFQKKNHQTGGSFFNILKNLLNNNTVRCYVLCTAITFKTENSYFGRTLDLEYSFDEKITITPRNYNFNFRYNLPQSNNYAIIGVGIIENNYPLYYDAINEKGLCIAGLNFPKSCKYNDINDKYNIASFELIPWILQNFETVDELEKLLNHINITKDSFNDKFTYSPLHWLIADNQKAITLEQTSNGLNIIDNELGVLANEPEFKAQLDNLSKYVNLSPYEPNNNFSNKIEISPDSRGLGAFGLPGDVSSSSRFVRVAFNKLNSICDNDEVGSVNQFFNILGTVKQLNGCVRLQNNMLEKTVYTSCYNINTGTIYYTTYNNSSISKIELFHENIDGSALIFFDMIKNADFICQN